MMKLFYLLLDIRLLTITHAGTAYNDTMNRKLQRNKCIYLYHNRNKEARVMFRLHFKYQKKLPIQFLMKFPFIWTHFFSMEHVC